MKSLIDGQNYNVDDEAKESVTWLKSQATSFYEEE